MLQVKGLSVSLELILLILSPIKLIAKPVANCNLRNMNHLKSLAQGKLELVLCCVVCCLFLYPGCAETLQGQLPAGNRQAWTRSKVQGHPGLPAAYDLHRVFSNVSFDNPVELVAMPGSDWMWMMELRGRIYAFNPNSDSPEKHLVIHLKAHAERMSDAYGLAFHPDFETNRYVYLCYVLGGGAPDGTRVSKFVVSETNPPTLLPESEEVLLTWKGGGHNGGCLRFGPDGFLYITTGDGTGPNPPDVLKTGQDITDLLASVLRIDVDHQDPGLKYAIPKDNPFVNHRDARPEVWAFGFRNPFKMSFDQANGDLWVGDVGWELWELIHRVEKGGNYGWSIMEGNHLVQEGLQQGPGMFRAPIVEHPHSEAASITGGYVYRGAALPDLRGAYIYSDYETGKIWGLRTQGDEVVWHEELTDAPFRVITFGEDTDGELWVVDYGGGLYRLSPHAEMSGDSDFPELLSQTGVFENVAHQIPSPGVYAYSVEMPHWENGAIARRWVGLPGNGRAQVNDLAAIFPTDAVLVKTLFWPEVEEAADDLPGKPLETQLMHYDGQHWNAYVYAWNADGSDARLVDAAGSVARSSDPNSILTSLQVSQSPSVWHYEARSNCLRCHNSWSGFALGWNKLQLKGTSRASDEVNESWDALSRLKLISANETGRSRRSKQGASMSDLEYRARAYLHANCGHCHRENAGAMVQSLMYFEKPTSEASLINQPVLRGNLGLPDASVIVPGDPFRSVLYTRMAKTGAGRMPHLGMQGQPDVDGVRLVYDWIRSMGSHETDTGNVTTRIMKMIDQVSQLSDDASAKLIIESLAGSLPGVLGMSYAMDSDLLDSSRQAMVQAQFETMVDPVRRDLLQRFFVSTSDLNEDLDLTKLAALKPDVENGRRLFFEDAALQCSTCHRMAEKGGFLGPDLNGIHEKYTLEQLFEQITQPSLVIAPEFGVTAIETKDGLLLSGILKEENDQFLLLLDMQGKTHKIDPTTVIGRQRSTLSAMPEGLLTGRLAQEVADLLGFLGYLK